MSNQWHNLAPKSGGDKPFLQLPLLLIVKYARIYHRYCCCLNLLQTNITLSLHTKYFSTGPKKVIVTFTTTFKITPSQHKVMPMCLTESKNSIGCIWHQLTANQIPDNTSFEHFLTRMK